MLRARHKEEKSLALTQTTLFYACRGSSNHFQELPLSVIVCPSPPHINFKLSDEMAQKDFQNIIHFFLNCFFIIICKCLYLKSIHKIPNKNLIPENMLLVIVGCYLSWCSHYVNRPWSPQKPYLGNRVIARWVECLSCMSLTWLTSISYGLLSLLGVILKSRTRSNP